MKRILIVIMLLLVSGLAVIWYAGGYLIAPAQQTVGNPPPFLAAVSRPYQSDDGNHIAGWLISGLPHQGVVLLVHGVRADRSDMLPRAIYLHQLGYTVYMIDLPAHGESQGDFISYGVHEAVAVNTAVRLLRQWYPHEHLGAIGVSLGAAAVVLAQPKPALDAVVLESMFPTIEQAVSNRMDFVIGSPAHLLSPLLLWQLPLRLHISPNQLHPISVIGQIHSPLLIAGGGVDPYTPPNETMQIYNAAQSPKSLWIVPCAAHVDLYEHAPREYEQRIGAFLGQYLPQKSDAGDLKDKR